MVAEHGRLPVVGPSRLWRGCERSRRALSENDLRRGGLSMLMALLQGWMSDVGGLFIRFQRSRCFVLPASALCTDHQRILPLGKVNCDLIRSRETTKRHTLTYSAWLQIFSKHPLLKNSLQMVYYVLSISPHITHRSQTDQPAIKLSNPSAPFSLDAESCLPSSC